MKAGGEDLVEREWDDELEAKLKRAWERLSGEGALMAIREATEADLPTRWRRCCAATRTSTSRTRPTRGSRRWPAT